MSWESILQKEKNPRSQIEIDKTSVHVRSPDSIPVRRDGSRER